MRTSPYLNLYITPWINGMATHIYSFLFEDDFFFFYCVEDKFFLRYGKYNRMCCVLMPCFKVLLLKKVGKLLGTC